MRKPVWKRPDQVKEQYVSPVHVVRTLNAFQQFINLSFQEMSRRMGFPRSTKLASIRSSTSVCTPEISYQLFRELGYLIDEYADTVNDLPPALKHEIIEYLDALIQPFAPKELQSASPYLELGPDGTPRDANRGSIGSHQGLHEDSAARVPQPSPGDSQSNQH